jgi:hypothetical protein
MKVLLDMSGERDADRAAPATPEELKSDIQTFIRDLERIRGGGLNLLDEKIAFFERWVEGPERRDILKSLKAMALFLEKGDASGLDVLKKEGAAGRAVEDRPGAGLLGPGRPEGSSGPERTHGSSGPKRPLGRSRPRRAQLVNGRDERSSSTVQGTGTTDNKKN